jgi:hypothetical protein
MHQHFQKRPIRPGVKGQWQRHASSERPPYGDGSN